MPGSGSLAVREGTLESQVGHLLERVAVTLNDNCQIYLSFP